MDKDYAKDLLKKYRAGNCTPLERKKVEDWITFGFFQDANISSAEVEEELSKIEYLLPITKRNTIWPKIVVASAAASIIFLLYFITFREDFYFSDNKAPVAVDHEIVPGKIGATLTLSNGKKIRLADVANGSELDESGIKVIKSANGKLFYKLTGQASGTNSFNTLSTLKGETYTISMPDGTLVYLNAASSLTYPISFASSGIRSVKLVGEAYFEVTKDPTRPFIVQTKNQKVEVLGTHFNINCYDDESSIKTTLLEGKVKVFTPKSAEIIAPGQQTVVQGENIKVKTVDIEESVAWKNSQIIISGQDIPSIMRMISRWYDVEIKYEGEIPTEKYYAKISRFDNLGRLLKLLEKAQGIHFKIEGRTVIVSK